MAAFHATYPLHRKAIELLRDDTRELLATSLVELELTQPQFDPRRKDEADFYLDYLRNIVTESADVTESLIAMGIDTVRSTQASAMDAMHLACAIHMGADEFVTSEATGKPLFREKRIPVVYLGNL